MSEKKSTNRTAEINDSIRDNTLRVVDEIAKVQPQVAQSVSNLQHDTIETSKNMFKTAYDTHKQAASGLNVSVPTQVSEQILKQSDEMTNNFERATRLNNQLGTSIQKAAIENTSIYSKTFNAYADYNANMLNAWTSFWGAQQQQFIRA